MPDFRVGHPRARFTKAADAAFPSGTQPIVWTAATYDDVAGWNGNSGYVVDRPGLYLIGFHISRGSLATAVQILAFIFVNGAIAQSFRGPALAAGNGVTGTALLQLAAGDVLELRARLGSTTTATLNDDCVMHLARIGPKRWT